MSPRPATSRTRKATVARRPTERRTPPPVELGVDVDAADKDLIGFGAAPPGTPYPLVKVRDLKGTFSLAAPDGMTTLAVGDEAIVYGDSEVSALMQMGYLTVERREYTLDEYRAYVDEPEPVEEPEAAAG